MEHAPDPASPDVLRILDAAANRAREALRVLEDGARFGLNDSFLTSQLKELRHDLAAALAPLPMDRALLARDTPGDVGAQIKTTSELLRADAHGVFTANAKRFSEALRSLEEFAKLFAPESAAGLERLRYRGYTLEQAFFVRLHNAPAMERFSRVRLYVLLTAELCHLRSGETPDQAWQRVLREILDAAASRDGGSGRLCIQLREKNLGDSDWLDRAKILADACRAAGALSIINDRPDIALLAGADGVHVGQADLPCDKVRRIVGPGMIVGVSTENLQQALRAMALGATYIAAGPMFATTTKHKPVIAGPAYASQATAVIDRPIVAIGGITLQNLRELTSQGIQRVAVSSAIVCSAEPGRAVQTFLEALG